MLEEIPRTLMAAWSDFVTARMGLHFPPEKWRDLARHMKPIATEFGFKSATQCIQWLLSSELTRAQLETLASHLTVGETYFFREKQIFEILKDKIVSEWIDAQRAKEKRLRIWSAGCCSGEEPYSIAIFLSKAIPDWKEWNITILATDINPRFLRKAAKGIYNEWSFRDTPAWVKPTCFKQLSSGGYEILPQFKEMVTFSYLNLAGDVYPSLSNNTNAMDLIFCRNVLMYFSDEQVQKVTSLFHKTLIDGGWLIVSATETSPVLYRQFTPTNLGGFTFYKKGPDNKRGATNPVLPSETIFQPDASVSCSEVFAAAIVENTETPYRTEAVVEEKSEEALALYEAGNYSDAIQKLLATASESSLNVEAATLLARAYANQGELGNALHWCEKAIAAEKMNPELHHLSAVILQEQGALEASVAALKRALYLDPEFVLAHFALGNLALRRNDFDEADKQFENALSLLKRCSPETILPGSEGLTCGRLSEIIRANMLQEKSA